MSFLARALNAIGLERRSINPAPNGAPYWANFAALRSGGAVTPASAESLSAAYACVSAISETIGSLPLSVYRRTEDGRVKDRSHPLYAVLHDAPNTRQSAVEFRETMTAHMLLRGNAYALIIRDHAGQVRELLPIHPDRVRVLDLENGRLGFEISDRDGNQIKLTQDEVFHLRHRSDDGIIGVSPIARAREVLSLAIAERDHGLETFETGARHLGVLKVPGVLDDAAKLALRDSWRALRSGSTPILEGGLDFQTVSMTLEDAEWISARQFSTEEVCRLFRVPPTIVGDLRHGNYANSVELARQFVSLSLRRHLVAWEQAISRQLLSAAARQTHFAEHNVEGLLRGDSTTRASFYHSAINDGWMTAEEVRKLENLPRLPRG